jgi:hypothetical protein
MNLTWENNLVWISNRNGDSVPLMHFPGVLQNDRVKLASAQPEVVV